MSLSFSARCVCSDTPYCRASAADSRIRSRLTENGVCVLVCSISGVSPAQIGYSARNQAKSSASCAAGSARVSVWNMW
jgi:hypothetical protein